jgi:hypothetical protein
LAEEPDTLHEPPHPLVAALAEALPAGSRVLLVGVGNGRHIPPLLEANLHVDAVEEDAGRATAATERFAGEPSVRVVRARYDGPIPFLLDYDGVVSTHALLHGSPSTIAASLAAIGNRMRRNALFHLTLGSIRDACCGGGVKIDDATWAAESGPESGVPHVFFDEKAARALLSDWNVLSLDERSASETAGRWAHAPAETATMIHWFARLKLR